MHLQLLLTILLCLSGLLGHLLLSRDASLNANAAKHKRDTKPLHLREPMAESENR